MNSGLHYALAILTLLYTVSCAPQPGRTRLSATPVGYGATPWSKKLEAVDQSQDIPVFIVTGRNVLDRPRGVNPFGDERNDSPLPNLGIARVGVGEGMSQREVIEDTRAVTGRTGKTRFRLKRVDLVPIEGVNLFAATESEIESKENQWIREIRGVLDRSVEREITVYVHGYNTEFITNTELVAGVSQFQARNGAVINFDWPSQGDLGGYFVDKGNAAYSTRQFRGLLFVLARETGAEKINIVAHSAGNPIVIDALREMRLVQRNLSPAQLQARYRINSVALAAPDMDMQAFINAVYDRFHEVARDVAVYTSSKDKALDLSGQIFKAERLGQAAEHLEGWEERVLLKVEDIQMIDVTAAQSKFHELLGHSYFHKNPWVSNDLGLFSSNLPPSHRYLQRNAGEIFWTFPSDYADLASTPGAGFER